MKKFDEIAFEYDLCRKQVEQFRSWLAGRVNLSEQNDVRPFFRKRRQMALLFGMFNQHIVWADRIGWEFDTWTRARNRG
jgi:hypothetical protein